MLDAAEPRIAPSRDVVWEAGCGSGQASRGLASHFDRVHATDPSAAQVAQAHGPHNITFAVEPGERCSLPDASVDAVCVAQALHWFDRAAFFAQCERVLKPGGLLVAWGYQDIEVAAAIAEANAALQGDIAGDWPPERVLIDEGYAGFDWPFTALAVPHFDVVAGRIQAEPELVREAVIDAKDGFAGHNRIGGAGPLELEAHVVVVDPVRPQDVRGVGTG